MTRVKRLALPGFMLAAAVTLGACEGSGTTPAKTDEASTHVALSKEVERTLARRAELVKPLLGEATILAVVRASNEKHRDISPEEISRLDQQWRSTKGVDGFVKEFLTNPCAAYLVAFQEAHEGFSEIFIADAKGLNVCQTNKTTDYYQADEEWWVKGFNDGKGHAYHGQIEYDESARSEAISLYVPVIDPQTQRAIGVAKAVVAITAIKREL